MSADIVYDDECNNATCKTTIETLKADNAAIEKKLSEMKTKYGQMLIDNLKKDVTLEELNKKQKDQNSGSSLMFFQKMIWIQSVPVGDGKQEDALFVRTAIRILYSNDLNILKNRYVTAKSKNGDKVQVTPEKRKIIDKIFMQRMDAIAAKEGLDDKRKTMLAKHIKAAIENINKANQ